jgi:hypothetical protein
VRKAILYISECPNGFKSFNEVVGLYISAQVSGRNATVSFEGSGISQARCRKVESFDPGGNDAGSEWQAPVAHPLSGIASD